MKIHHPVIPMRQPLSKQKMILKINLQKTLIQMEDYLAKQHRPTLQVVLLTMNRQTINFQESPMAMLNLKQHLKRVKQLQKFKVNRYQFVICDDVSRPTQPNEGREIEEPLTRPTGEPTTSPEPATTSPSSDPVPLTQPATATSSRIQYHWFNLRLLPRLGFSTIGSTSNFYRVFGFSTIGSTSNFYCVLRHGTYDLPPTATSSSDSVPLIQPEIQEPEAINIEPINNEPITALPVFDEGLLDSFDITTNTSDTGIDDLTTAYDVGGELFIDDTQIETQEEEFIEEATEANEEVQ